MNIPHIDIHRIHSHVYVLSGGAVWCSMRHRDGVRVYNDRTLYVDGDLLTSLAQSYGGSLSAGNRISLVRARNGRVYRYDVPRHDSDDGAERDRIYRSGQPVIRLKTDNMDLVRGFVYLQDHVYFNVFAM